MATPINLHEQPAAQTATKAPCDNDLRVPYFCEENAWRICYRRMREQYENRFFVVFISNSMQLVPMFHQRASSDPGKPCCWDYHVILQCVTPRNEVLVYDIDSHLPYPTPLQVYLDQSFAHEESSPFAPLFRVVPGETFIREFSSDRKHMFNAETNSWSAPLPPYDCINMSQGRRSTFRWYNDFSQGELQHDPSKYGTILTKEQMIRYGNLSFEHMG